MLWWHEEGFRRYSAFQLHVLGEVLDEFHAYVLTIRMSHNWLDLSNRWDDRTQGAGIDAEIRRCGAWRLDWAACSSLGRAKVGDENQAAYCAREGLKLPRYASSQKKKKLQKSSSTNRETRVGKMFDVCAGTSEFIGMVFAQVLG